MSTMSVRAGVIALSQLQRPAAGGHYWTLMDEIALYRYELELTCRTSVDVDGRPWMAPRAGFELARKFLVALVMRGSNRRNTPSDTPMHERTGSSLTDLLSAQRRAASLMVRQRVLKEE